jgi:hypothetical protein
VSRLRAVVLLALLCCSTTRLDAQRPCVWSPYAGVHLVHPTGPSVALGCKPESDRGVARFLIAEPGLHGIRVGVGYGFFEYDELPITKSARLSVLHTWNTPWNLPPNATYLGVEARAGALFTLGLGLYGRVSSGESGATDVLLSWSVGIGF